MRFFLLLFIAIASIAVNAKDSTQQVVLIKQSEVDQLNSLISDLISKEKDWPPYDSLRFIHTYNFIKKRFVKIKIDEFRDCSVLFKLKPCYFKYRNSKKRKKFLGTDTIITDKEGQIVGFYAYGSLFRISSSDLHRAMVDLYMRYPDVIFMTNRINSCYEYISDGGCVVLLNGRLFVIGALSVSDKSKLLPIEEYLRIKPRQSNLIPRITK